MNGVLSKLKEYLIEKTGFYLSIIGIENLEEVNINEKINESLKKFKEQLELAIVDSSEVFIVGHNEPDFDSIASSIGIATLVKSLDKKAYIIVDDDPASIEPGVKKIISEIQDEFNIITLEQFKELKKEDSLLIMTDVNKHYMVSVKDYINQFKKIIVIDHHDITNETVQTDTKYITTKVSSASEVIAQLLNFTHIKYPKKVASFLLAGIVLDTQRFKRKTTSRTYDVSEKLMNKGADPDYVNDLFLEEFEAYCKINNLIVNGTIFKQYMDTNAVLPLQVSFTLNREKPTTVYKRDELAKATDRMRKFRNDAAFTLGYTTDGLVTISARSGKNINVGKILSELPRIGGNGGGDPERAGGKVKSDDILKTEEQLMEIVDEMINRLEIKEEPTQSLVDLAQADPLQEKSNFKILRKIKKNNTNIKKS